MKKNIYYLKGMHFYFEKPKQTDLDNESYHTIKVRTEGNKWKKQCSNHSFELICVEAFLIICAQYNRNGFFVLKNQETGRVMTREFFQNLTFETLYKRLFAENTQNSETGLFENCHSGLNIIAGRKADCLSENADLMLTVDDALHIELTFTPGILEDEYICAMGEGMEQILNSLNSDVDCDVLKLPLLTEESSYRLIEYGRNHDAFDFTKPLYQMFMLQADRTPEMDACIYIDENRKEHRISYRLLDEASSVLAVHLQKAGVTKEVAVGVYMQRSLNLVISLLGILKSGGIYLPLDLSYPEKYLNSIMNEVNPLIVLVEQEPQLFEKKKVIVLNINQLTGKTDFVQEDTLDHTAVIMYTSGSTGRPKGVRHKQLQVINRLNFMWTKYPFREGDRLAQRTTMNYMPSMWELLGGLLKGITTVIFSDCLTKDPDLFLELIAAYHVTYLTVVPSLFQMLSTAGEKFHHLAGGVRIWITCGEPVTSEIYQAFCRVFPYSTLINDYGSTEVNGILYFDTDSIIDESTELPLLQPVTNADIYLFDEEMKQVPIGMPGCIYVGGIVLSTGYINNDKLNQEKFVLNPLTEHKNQTLFQIGDMAFFHKDGRIEMLGRSDHQVKVRGIRMDLDGIERVLEDHEAVQHAVVAVKKQHSGNKYLMAYVKPQKPVSEQEIRAYLGRNLPGYMIPVQYAFLKQMPKLPNGKIDRKAIEEMSLHKVDHTAMKLEEGKKAFKEQAAALAADVLGIPKEEILTNRKYYEIGFDSVSIVDFMRKLNEQLGTQIKISDLYDHPCIDDLAALYSDLQIVGELEADAGSDNLLVQSPDLTLDLLKSLVVMAQKILGVREEEIKTDRKFYEIGFDSVSITELLKEINEQYQAGLTLSDIYDNATISDLVCNCLSGKQCMTDASGTEYEKQLVEMISGRTGIHIREIYPDDRWEELGLGTEEKAMLLDDINKKYDIRMGLYELQQAENIAELGKTVEAVLAEKGVNTKQETVCEPADHSEEEEEQKGGSGSDKIAVIGMACHFPGAGNKEELWENLLQGINSITEIPEERWNCRKSGGESTDSGNPEPKWGGFLDDIRGFDAKYFGISMKEARLMDPQQRICLEETYHAIEDAGYAIHDVYGKNIGVFIGARPGDYNYNLREHAVEPGGFAFMGNDSAIISARVSYLLNLHGPCMTIDTACSSSLTAIHQAASAIRQGECNAAVTGGVFVMNSEYLFANSAKMGMLSKEGQCKTFDNEADGFVPAEGAGIILLKNYTQAVADGDRIYGVIIASGINQDGKTNGITAPSSEAQFLLEKKIYEKAGINPETISYVETHGTGTKLGDPIEVEALKRTFGEWTQKKQFCALGSIKTNIGHCVTASGAAGIIKILLCMQHEKLPANLNFNQCNQYIDLQNSPFYVLKEPVEWKNQTDQPRRAALSSFGFGGSNGHMLLEDYAKKTNKEALAYYFFPLSAVSGETLLEKAVKLIDWLSDKDGAEAELGDLSLTLIGIEKYSCRTAFIADSKTRLLTELKKMIKDPQKHFVYTTPGNDAIAAGFIADMEQRKAELFLQTVYRIREEYLKGKDTRILKKYYQNKGYEIISLPPYPYQKETCYLDHPMRSDTKENEDFTDKYGVQDHRLNTVAVLPGAAYLDLMSDSYKRETGSAGNTLSNITFIKAYKPKECSKKLLIDSAPKDEKMQYQIYTEDAGKKSVYATGSINFAEVQLSGNVALNAVRQKCKNRMSRMQCYQNFSKMRLFYGNMYQCIDEILYNENISLSRINVKKGTRFAMNPMVIDAAFQSVLPLLNLEKETRHLYIPCRVDQITVCASLETARYVYAERKTGKENYDYQKYDLKILDTFGTVISVILGFTRKRAKGNMEYLHVYKTGLRAMPKQLKASEIYHKNILIFDDTECLKNELEKRYGSRIISVTNGGAFLNFADDRFSICYGNENDYQQLFHMLKLKNVRLDEILYLGAYQSRFRAGLSVEEEIERSLYAFTGLVKSFVSEMPGKTVSVLCFYDGQLGNGSFYEALSGFVICQEKECPNVKIRLIDLAGVQKDSASFTELVVNEMDADGGETWVRYHHGSRMVKDYEPIQLEQMLSKRRSYMTEHGVYIITGALGGIGSSLVNYLLARYEIHLVLLGRRKISDHELSGIFQGGHITYYQTDMGTETSVRRTFYEIEQKFGRIDGIFHCAGSIRDSLLRNKTKEHMHTVLEPKVMGILALEKVLAKNPSCFLVCFSSIAAVTGNLGQCDYAYANAFMDAWTLKQPNLNLFSINWGLWEEGTMGNDPLTRKNIEEQYGLQPIKDVEGFQMMFHLMEAGIRNAVVLKGNTLEELKHTMNKTGIGQENSLLRMDVFGLKEKLEQELMALLGDIFEQAHFSKDSRFEEEELDSISLMEFADAVSSRFECRITPASLLEYNTIKKLSSHMLKGQEEKFAQYFGLTDHDPILEPDTKAAAADVQFKEAVRNRDVAVVGISGRFPDADNVEEFWDNLMEHRCSITQVPENRWDLEQFDEEIRDYMKYGGFLKDMEAFDSAYFHISPAEAKLMDPQQRILLEETVKCFSNAGISSDELSGTNTNVYIGAFSSDFLQILNRSQYRQDANVIAGNDHAMLSNRISYFFNLKGTSETVDTACSSALACTLRAVKDIRNGECEGAVVGAVSLMLDPLGSVRVGNLGFLNKDGIIKSFDSQADGYSRGEGAGVIYLKPFDAAVRDGNNILAVIKGGASNHNGKGRYLMEPNALQEAEVVKAAYRDAGMLPGMVNYIEAHGTGTKIGDMNEIYAFKKAFRDMQEESQIEIPEKFCGIGTVKPNIGHLEAASGMASLLKLIMALNKKQIPAMLLYKEADPELGLTKSSFYIQSENMDWKTINDQAGRPMPRRGEVHAYGYGGTNVHLILEEYEESPGMDEAEEMVAQSLIFPISAASGLALQQYIRKYEAYIKSIDSSQIGRLAYSMQTAGDGLPERIAFVADSKEELVCLMQDYQTGKQSPNVKIKLGKDTQYFVNDVFSKDSAYEIVQMLKERRNWNAIASLWVHGMDIDWKKLFGYRNWKKLNLPPYPFSGEVYPVNGRMMGNPLETDHLDKTIEPQVSSMDVPDTAEEKLGQMLADCLELPEVQEINSRNLQDLGFNSIMLARFKFKAEEFFGLQLKTAVLASKTTAGEMIAYIKNEIEIQRTKRF